MPTQLMVKTKGISGAVLKNVAIILMVINHVSIGLCNSNLIDVENPYYNVQWFITRASFIIFTFLIAEGMVHTRNRIKYISQLFAMAIISEVFYDKLIIDKVPYWNTQNVFFILFFGASAIYLIDRFKTKPIIPILTTTAIFIVCVLSRAEYGIMGVAIILLFYYLRDRKNLMLVTVAIAIFVLYLLDKGIDSIIQGKQFDILSALYYTILELHGLFAFPLIKRYNGIRGKQLPKLFYYLFYPGHLIVILLIIQVITQVIK